MEQDELSNDSGVFAGGAKPRAIKFKIKLSMKDKIAVNGYYPLYATEAASNNADNGNGTSHSHVLNGVTYYMPNELPSGQQYHGNYTN